MEHIFKNLVQRRVHTRSQRSNTLHNCLQISRFFSNGVSTSFSLSSSLSNTRNLIRSHKLVTPRASRRLSSCFSYIGLITDNFTYWTTFKNRCTKTSKTLIDLSQKRRGASKVCNKRVWYLRGQASSPSQERLPFVNIQLLRGHTGGPLRSAKH